MRKQNDRDSFWKVIEFDVANENAIIQLDQKLSKRVSAIVSVCIYCIPNQTLDKEIRECGELSLGSTTNGPFLHVNTNYSHELSDELIPNILLARTMGSDARVNGYYRDLAKMKDRDGSFIPYRVKILMECVTLPAKS